MPEPETTGPLPALMRGARGRCPNCGRGRLFRAYLKHVDACASCATSFTDIEAADGPAWFTMILVGALLMPFAFILIMAHPFPTWLILLILVSLATLVSLLCLQTVKGAFIGLIWANRHRE